MKKPLVISLGTNLGDRVQNLSTAETKLEKLLGDYSKSQIVESEAVDYLDQPAFLNQVFLFENYPADLTPELVLKLCLGVENEMAAREKLIKGTRVIDIDLLFFGSEHRSTEFLELPHPRLFERSFIVKPLSELSCFNYLEQNFAFPKRFNNSCHHFEPKQQNRG